MKKSSKTNQKPVYAELAVTTNFSFLRGASHPEDYVAEAARLNLAGIGIADRNTLSGVVRAHVALKETEAADSGLKLAIGCRLVFADGTPDLLAYPQDRAAYGRLSRLLSLGKRRAEKGECHLTLDDLLAESEGLLLILIPPEKIDDETIKTLEKLSAHTPDHLWLGAIPLYHGRDKKRLQHLAELTKKFRIPLIALNDALYHHPDRRRVQDVFTCIREHQTIETIGKKLEAHAERHLKCAADMAHLFRDHPEALEETTRFFARLSFSLDELRYEYPDEPVPEGKTPQQHLTDLAYEGATRRYPKGVPDKIKAALAKELALIEELDYAPYFLTVNDIVSFARSQNILCQGRGSAANSVVCYCLGVTAVDPTEIDLLFERFISAERREPPDIDVDFEHERREEVIQWIYKRYGRERAGLAATVISYRPRSEIGRAHV